MLETFGLMIASVIFAVLIWTWMFPNEFGRWIASVKHAYGRRTAELQTHDRGR